ncbi:hypothetical protein HK096_000568, partial [Nowakowskiella sp. JEL0078]
YTAPSSPVTATANYENNDNNATEAAAEDENNAANAAEAENKTNNSCRELSSVHFISIETNDGCNAGWVLSTKEECKQTGSCDSKYDCYYLHGFVVDKPENDILNRFNFAHVEAFWLCSKVFGRVTSKEYVTLEEIKRVL